MRTARHGALALPTGNTSTSEGTVLDHVDRIEERETKHEAVVACVYPNPSPHVSNQMHRVYQTLITVPINSLISGDYQCDVSLVVRAGEK